MTTVHVNFQYVLCSGIELEVEAEVDMGRAPTWPTTDGPGDIGTVPQIMSMDITLHGKTVDVSGLHVLGALIHGLGGRRIEYPAVHDRIEQEAIEEALDEEAA